MRNDHIRIPTIAENLIYQVLDAQDNLIEEQKLSFLRCVSQIFRDHTIANTFINDKNFVLMLFDALLDPQYTDVCLVIVEKFSRFTKTKNYALNVGVYIVLLNIIFLSDKFS